MGILHEDVVVISQAEKAGEPTTSTSPSTSAIDASSSNPTLGSQSERREGMLRSSAIGGRLAVWEGDFVGIFCFCFFGFEKIYIYFLKLFFNFISEMLFTWTSWNELSWSVTSPTVDTSTFNV
ncbi:unnamed protein product [Prunus armeniaca]|uniref:Uncharacterized protein n=1 Tax=Prunus armeniaca TaxID=36596 RepID=A0A6J5U4M9_PRUAR|nr:unnamed protein product [Prunus armeniaca]